MTERELKDPTGKVVFRAVEYDGTSFPAIIFGNIANQLRELNEMTFKEGDLCCSISKIWSVYAIILL